MVGFLCVSTCPLSPPTFTYTYTSKITRLQGESSDSEPENAAEVATQQPECLSDSQDLQRSDLVFEDLLGLVEVSQDDLCFSVMNYTDLPQIPLISRVRVLMVSFREWISWSRSVMRLLREHSSACMSEMRTISSCSWENSKRSVCSSWSDCCLRMSRVLRCASFRACTSSLCSCFRRSSRLTFELLAQQLPLLVELRLQLLQRGLRLRQLQLQRLLQQRDLKPRGGVVTQLSSELPRGSRLITDGERFRKQVMLIESVMVEQRGRDMTEMDEETNGTSTTPESETDRLTKSVTHPRSVFFLLTAVHLSTSGPSRLPSCPSSVSLLFGWTSLWRAAAGYPPHLQVCQQVAGLSDPRPRGVQLYPQFVLSFPQTADLSLSRVHVLLPLPHQLLQYLPLLLLLLLLRLLPQGLVLPLQLLQRSDLRLLEAMHLLLVVRAQLAQLLLVALPHHSLFVLLAAVLALVQHRLALLLQPAQLLLQPALLLVQAPDGRLVGHLGGLQRADLTWEQSDQRLVLRVLQLHHPDLPVLHRLLQLLVQAVGSVPVLPRLLLSFLQLAPQFSQRALQRRQQVLRGQLVRPPHGLQLPFIILLSFAQLPLKLLHQTHLLGQPLLVLCGGGALVLLVVQEFLHLLAVRGSQILQRSPFLRLKLRLSLAERPQLLLKIPTHLLHLLRPRDIFYSVLFIDRFLQTGESPPQVGLVHHLALRLDFLLVFVVLGVERVDHLQTDRRMIKHQRERMKTWS
ncbi:hypothetical protein F7725_009024 [Dissostichus mawsoni]|uniref:Uncharacterized protein n=1 Tax=Dissostichus mawsoni TaxID=36200 RepID=A0A7J5Z5Y0_DISMA|nr:hypothetical protein F7725_009024 [Dissostichus mawsoni]